MRGESNPEDRRIAPFLQMRGEPEEPLCREVILERGFRLMNEHMHALALQRRRVSSTEPEDRVFLFRTWSDLRFLIIALNWLRRDAKIVATAAGDPEFEIAIAEFEKGVPFKILRDVGEHMDDYAIDSKKRRVKSISPNALECGTWDGTTFSWLGESLNVDTALEAAKRLLASARRCCRVDSIDRPALIGNLPKL